MELHERVRYLRTILLDDMTQKDFADVLEVSRDEINNIEGNRLKKPEQKRPLLLLMCKQFNVDERWLLDGIGDPRILPAPDAETDYINDLLSELDNPFIDAIRAVMQAYEESSPEDKKRIKDFAARFTHKMQKENRD